MNDQRRCWTPDKNSRENEVCPVCSPALAASEEGRRRWYKQTAKKYLFHPPPVKSPEPQKYLPGGLEEWEPGEEIVGIDWRASVLSRGPFAAAAPLVRQYMPDDPIDPARTIPSVEIYLDTSGSMPNPLHSPPEACPMTVAALVVALSCLRAKGRVRGVIWSSGRPCIARTWMRDEELVLKFFLQAIGGGTDFPFDTFEDLSAEAGPARGAIRVIVSDSDLEGGSNFGGRYGAISSHHLKIIRDACKRSERLVLLLANVGDETAKLYDAMSPGKISTYPVESHAGLPKIAAGVADTLFGKKARK